MMFTYVFIVFLPVISLIFITSSVTVQCNTIESKCKLFNYVYMYLSCTYCFDPKYFITCFPLIREREVNFVIEV